MFATYLTVVLCAVAIVSMFSIAIVRGGSDRLADSQKRKTEWRRA